MVTDRQIRRLMSLLQAGQSQQVSADKAGMDCKTARKYRRLGQLPSALRKDHAWRTRSDPFAGVWPWVVEQLSLNPGLEAKTLLEALQRAHPGQFADGQLRTLQRQVKRWRGLEGPGKEVFFAQVHHPGRLCQSDFSHMTNLAVTIAGRTLEHLIYHFVLTYSNWEAFTLCYSESFESLSEGLQNALWELGAVPQRHRSDRLGAAVANGSDMKTFTARYQGLLAHYDLLAEKTNPDSGHENGDVEQRHHRFKRAVDQALMLRGSGLVTALLEAREERQLERMLKHLQRQELIVADELGYVPFSKPGAELLFEVVSRAYERTSLIVTTNLPFENWPEVCGSERLTGAMLDRLTHRVHILEANGESYRLRQSKRRLKRQAKPEDQKPDPNAQPPEG
jgi:hypothetical protein